MIESTDAQDSVTAERMAALTGALSPETRSVIAALVERTIEREYGQVTYGQVRGCRMLAMSGVSMDTRRPYVATNGRFGDIGHRSAADAVLRQVLAEGLAARLCQCRVLHPAGCPHTNGPVEQCAGHYEADVPELHGALLCGPCHVAVYETPGAR